MNEWQPIITFPATSVFDVWVEYYLKDGTKSGRRYVNVWWDGTGFIAGELGYIRGVAYWMPLPKPPKGE